MLSHGNCDGEIVTERTAGFQAARYKLFLVVVGCLSFSRGKGRIMLNKKLPSKGETHSISAFHMNIGGSHKVQQPAGTTGTFCMFSLDNKTDPGPVCVPSHVQLCSSYALVDVVGSGTGWGYNPREDLQLRQCGSGSKQGPDGGCLLFVDGGFQSFHSLSSDSMTLFSYSSQVHQSYNP